MICPRHLTNSAINASQYLTCFLLYYVHMLVRKSLKSILFWFDTLEVWGIEPITIVLLQFILSTISAWLLNPPPSISDFLKIIYTYISVSIVTYIYWNVTHRQKELLCHQLRVVVLLTDRMFQIELVEFSINSIS